MGLMGTYAKDVKIAKDAPIGTAITVTSIALGAPEPVEGTLQLVVSGE